MVFARSYSVSGPSRRFRSMRGILARLGTCVSVARQRRSLAALPDEALADIGLSAQDVRAETQRPFWDVPANWKA